MSDDRRHERRTEEMKIHISREDMQRNFLIYYGQFIDLEKRNRDKEAYGELLNRLNKRISKQIFKSNALILCDYPIMPEVFLTIFSKHPKLLTFRYLTVTDISDCWEGRLQSNNLNLDERDTLFAVKDINEDVMCSYVSKDSLNASKLHCQYLSSVMSERFTRKGKNIPKQVSFLFFCGTKELLNKESDRYFGIVNFFSSEYNGAVIDLNSDFQIMSLCKKLTLSSKPKNSSSINTALDY